MTDNRQIVKAMAVIRRPADGALLVSAHVSPSGEAFHRYLGGHVEFGEYAADTIRRELREEIGQDLTGVSLLGVVENIFSWGGATQHEIVFMFAAAFADRPAYEIAEQGIRDDLTGAVRVIWRPPGTVSPPLYPVMTGQLAAGNG